MKERKEGGREGRREEGKEGRKERGKEVSRRSEGTDRWKMAASRV